MVTSPPNVPPPDAMVAVTGAFVGEMLPASSLSATTAGVGNRTYAVLATGWVRIASVLGVPGARLKVFEVTGDSPGVENVSVRGPMVPESESPLNVATPFT